MVAIAPFRALRYDPRSVDLGKVTSPPHDVIPAAAKPGFLAAEPHNIVRVVLPDEESGDAEPPTEPNKFARAAGLLSDWEAHGVMRRDERPALYLYEISHDLFPGGPRATMRGLLCRLRLDPSYTEVRRHEKTLYRKKRERLHLREATLCDTEPIWLLYHDERGWVEEVLRSNAFDELVSFTDEEDHSHRLWRVDRPQAVGEVVAQFEERHLVIADGHHRYQTALDHFAATGDPRHGSILVCLVRDNDPGTRIAATHRLVHGLPFPDAVSAVAAAGASWEATTLPARDDPAAAVASLDPSGRECIVVGRSGPDLSAWRLRLRDGAEVREGRGRLDGLAVIRVHERLFRDAWGLDLETPEEHLRFTRSAREALAAVRDGTAQVAVLLPPESPASVLQVAEEGHLMPQKATFFVPKLRSGIVLGPLDEAPPVSWQERAGGGGKAEWRRLPL